MEGVLKSIYDTGDADTKQACLLIQYIVSTDFDTMMANFEKIQGEIKENSNDKYQKAFDTFLATFGYQQTKDTPEDRFISPAEFIGFFSVCKELLESIADTYTPVFQKSILKEGIEDLGSQEGNKFIDYRFSHFIQWLQIFVVYQKKFTEKEFLFLMNYPIFFKGFFTYQKGDSIQDEITKNYKGNSYKNVKQMYVSNKTPFLELLLNLYKKDKNIGTPNTVLKIATALKVFMQNKNVRDVKPLQIILSKFLDEADVKAILANITFTSSIKNIFQTECDLTELVSIPCPGNASKKIKVCPENEDDMQGAYLEVACKSSGGRRRKTRRRKSPKSKRTYRKRRN